MYFTAYDDRSDSPTTTGPRLGYSSLQKQTISNNVPFEGALISPILSLETELRQVSNPKADILTADELNETINFDDEVPLTKERSFSFNRALNETQYFSFVHEPKVPQSKSIASLILDTFKPRTQTIGPVETDLLTHDTSDEEVDRSLLHRFHVIKNNLKMSLAISSILFVCLVLPYFLRWYSEPSNVPGADLYFGVNHVWVPVKSLVFDASTNSFLSEINYNRVKLSSFLVSGCPSSMLPLEKCESYNSLQFASFCYLPLKLLSQLVHAVNIVLALREILTVRS